jgi:acetylornithine deacetylase/succinyl-diaminopimelate desuccinylase-like protein
MKKFISDVLQNEAVQDLAKLVAVPSFNSEAKAKAPFGAGPKKALQTVLKIAGELGF